MPILIVLFSVVFFTDISRFMSTFFLSSDLITILIFVFLSMRMVIIGRLDKKILFFIIILFSSIFLVPFLASLGNGSISLSGVIFILKRLLVGLVILASLYKVMIQGVYYRMIIAILLICIFGIWWSIIDMESFSYYYLDQFDAEVFGGLNPMGGGFQVNRNGAAYMLVVCQAILSTSPTNKERAISLLQLFSLITVAATASRSGMILSLLVVFIFGLRVGFRSIIFYLIIIFTLASKFDIGLEDVRIYNRLKENQDEANLSTNSRIGGMVEAQQLILQYPLLGTDTFAENQSFEVASHNFYIDLIQKNGIIGAVIFYILIILFIQQNINVLFVRKLFLPFCVFVIIGFFDHFLIQSKYALVFYSYLILLFCEAKNSTYCSKS